MVELKGSLNSLGLPAIVQLIGELHHTGNLELTTHAAYGVLGFEDGRLVAATLRDLRGLPALAACATELADADFVFVEGAPADTRTLALGGSELQQRLSQFMSGEVTPETLDPPVQTDETTVMEICPMLGFVDAETRHYSRPTAMHRCFAGGAPSLVTAQEQRDLCLSGRYPACPRFRNTPTSRATGPPPKALVPPQAAVPPLRAARSTPGVPAGVAARVAAAGQMRMANQESADDVRTWIGQNPQDGLSASPETATRPGLRSRRGVLLVVAGGGLGLLALMAAVLFAMPDLRAGLAPKPSNAVAALPAAEPQPTVTRAPATAVRPTPAPTPAPVSTRTEGTGPISTLPPRPATPTVRLVPTVAVASATGQSLLDVRFASGPKPGWLDNPPYVGWSDGAYRFQARQATHFVAVSAPIGRPLGDVAVSATLRKTGGPPGGGYGLVIRDQSPDLLDGVNQDASFYVVETSDQGDIGVWRRDGDHWVDLVPWAHSDSVRPGGSPNDLAVRAIGDKLTFMVNESQVASVQDDTLVTGGVGVFVGGDYNEVGLDRFVVQVPD